MLEHLTHDELKTEFLKLTEELELVRHELRLKNEEVDFLRHKLFGRSKETNPASVNQFSLFDGIPPIEESTELPEEVYETKKNKKKKGKKKKVLNQFEEVSIVHDFDDKTCECCHQVMKEIGQTKVREELVFIPATFERQVHYAKSYKCESCSEVNGND